MSGVARPTAIEVADLILIVPSLVAGAQALRERERWARTLAFLPITAREAGRAAADLERLAHRIEPRPWQARP